MHNHSDTSARLTFSCPAATLFALAAASVGMPSFAYAQDAEGNLDEIVVTAARTADDAGVGVLGRQPVMATPLSVTGYTSAMILDQGARSTSEVLANDPSVRTQSAGDGNYDYFSLRGFSISASAFSLNGLFGVLPWNTFSPETVEQFEVIRGPSTTLTGASPFDNPGGSINIQPKRAGAEPLVQLTGALDAGGQTGLHLDLGRRLGSRQEWGLRLNAAYRDGDLAREHQSERVRLASVGLDYSGERLRASLDAGFQKFRTDGANFLFYIYEGTDVPRAPDLDENVSPDWAFADSRDVYAAGRVEFDASDTVTLYAAAGTREHESSILNPYSEIADGDGNLSVYPYQESYFAKTNLSAEAGLRMNLVTGPLKHRLVFSGSTIRFNTGWLGTYSDGFTGLPEYESNIYSPNYPPRPDLTGTPNDGELQLRNRLTGVSVVDAISIADERYQLLLGLRRQKFDIERLYDPGNPYNDSAWSPSLGLLAKLNDRLSVYANYLVGLSQGPFAPVGTVNQNQPFPPSKTTQYELGAKAKFGSLFASIALFQITQPAGLTDPDTNTFNVNGEQRHRGVELTFSGDVGRGARLLGGANYLDAKLARTEGGLLDGNRAPGVPQFAANLGGEIDLAFMDGLTLTGRVIYTGKAFIFGDNGQSIPDWTRLDVGARYATAIGAIPVVLRLNVTNVTGEDYWASAKGFGLSLGSARSALLSATVSF
jgi:iron complex outermembrane recepter protein